MTAKIPRLIENSSHKYTAGTHNVRPFRATSPASEYVRDLDFIETEDSDPLQDRESVKGYDEENE